MMEAFLEALGKDPSIPPFTADLEAVNWYVIITSQHNFLLIVS